MKGKREISFMLLTLLVVAAIFAVTSWAIKRTDLMMSDYCFKELGRAATSLASDLKYAIDSDATTLRAMARLIAGKDELLDEVTLEMMNSFSGESVYISSVELLTPDGVITNEKGEKAEAGGCLDFESEAASGARLSGKSTSPFNGEYVIRSGVPVVKNGETVGMLYGVIELKRLIEAYKTDIYDGQAYVYVIDGESGDFLLDTWHKTLGNLAELGERKTIRGYDMNASREDMRNLKSGNIGFVSRTTGQVLYMRYEPIGINRLSVMITVSEDVAFMQMRSISKSLYVMAVFDGALLLIYMIIIGISLFKAYRAVQRIGFEDQTTLLQNRIAYDKYVNETQATLFETVACVYVDANGLHEINNRFGHDAGDQMLKTISDALKTSFPPKCLYRIGGDEFVMISSDFGIEACEKKIYEVEEYVSRHEYTVSMGLAWRENEVGLNRVIQEADERMLSNKRKYYETHDRRINYADGNSAKFL